MKMSSQQQNIIYVILPLSALMTLPFNISQRYLLYFLGGLILLLMVVTVVGERGAIHLWRLRGEKSRIDEQNYRLQKENEALQQRVSRIRNDNHYLEKLAREELNLVRPGEVIYRFPKSKPDKDGRNLLNEAPSESRPSAARK
jgi:cell division protein FtsB